MEVAVKSVERLVRSGRQVPVPVPELREGGRASRSEVRWSKTERWPVDSLWERKAISVDDDFDPCKAFDSANESIVLASVERGWVERRSKITDGV